ncbi:hypothetical protein ACFV9D_01530 [Streptomyces sp. NPDC059875]|uniref:hypothetical protein n=1 Tax=unclassified Streptomyces TaxID=2593676 RepID=UPI003656B84F
MRIRAVAAGLVAAALLTVTACASDPERVGIEELVASASAAEAAREDVLRDASRRPEEPTGAQRAELLAALREAAPETVRYEDEAVEAARDQCQSLNHGAYKPDWFASQHFTYRDVTITEAQGKVINQALKDSGFCDIEGQSGNGASSSATPRAH